MRAPSRAVVDTSVAVKLFVPERLAPQAHSVFAKLGDLPDSELIVPDLLYIECANVFWKWVRRFKFSEAQAREDLDTLQRIDLRVISTSFLASQAFEIAVSFGITAYDACFAAAAAFERAPLITADAKLVNSLRNSPVAVLWLGDLEP